MTSDTIVAEHRANGSARTLTAGTGFSPAVLYTDEFDRGFPPLADGAATTGYEVAGYEVAPSMTGEVMVSLEADSDPADTVPLTEPFPALELLGTNPAWYIGIDVTDTPLTPEDYRLPAFMRDNGWFAQIGLGRVTSFGVGFTLASTVDLTSDNPNGDVRALVTGGQAVLLPVGPVTAQNLADVNAGFVHPLLYFQGPFVALTGPLLRLAQLTLYIAAEDGPAPVTPVLPYVRVYPRDDGRGQLSSPRRFPLPKSQRRVGGHT